MADDQAAKSSCEDEYCCGSIDHVDMRFYQLLETLESRKKLTSLSIKDHTMPKLDKVIMEMIERLGKDFSKIDFKKDFFETAEILEMLYRSTTLVEALWKAEGLKVETEGVSEIIHQLVTVLEETHLEKKH